MMDFIEIVCHHKKENDLDSQIKWERKATKEEATKEATEAMKRRR